MTETKGRSARWGMAMVLGWIAVIGRNADAKAPPADSLPDLEWRESSGDVEEIREIIAAGDRAFARSRNDSAIRLYSVAVRARPRDIELRWARARAFHAKYGSRGCAEDAIADLAFIREVLPGKFHLRHALALSEWLESCHDRFLELRVAIARELLAQADNSRDGARLRLRLARAMLLILEQSPDGDPAMAKVALEHMLGHRKALDAEGIALTHEALDIMSRLYLAAGEVEAALVNDRRLLDRGPGADLAARVRERIERGELESQVRSHPLHGPASPLAREALARAQAALTQGDEGEARRELTRATELDPGYAAAYKWLGHLLARNDDTVAEAIVAYKQAILLAPEDHEPHASLGLIYLHAGPSRHRAARRELRQALDLRPDRADLRLYLAQSLMGHDDRAARRELEEFLQTVRPDHHGVKRAREWLRQIDTELASAEVPVVIPSAFVPRAGAMDPELHHLLVRALVLGKRHGRWGDAFDELKAAERDHSGRSELHVAIATAATADQKSDVALKHWKLALEIDPELPEVHERLGFVHPDLGRRRHHLQEAARLGSRVAMLELAQRLWDGWQLWPAQRQVAAFLATSGPHELGWERARHLEDRLGRAATRLYSVLAAAGGLVVLAFGWWLRRRFFAWGLERFLAAEPSAFPEVARVIGLIRHEILKHNTGLLGDVADGVLKGHPTADSRAGLLAQRLFGQHERSSGSARAQFDGYLDELETLAAARGHRMDLRRCDPVFSPMSRAFDRLETHVEDLRRLDSARGDVRRNVAAALRSAAGVLGPAGFSRLGQILDGLCWTRVDAEFLMTVHRKVAAEPSFVDFEVDAPVVQGEPARVRIYPESLADVIANVVRNALASMARHGPGPLRVGFALVAEVDAITGVMSLAIRVRDESPEVMTDEMLRGRYIEHGMGLIVDLLARFDGAINVEPDPPWAKAVVLRFFAAESIEGHTGSSVERISDA